MALFDLRHKWGEPVHNGNATISRTCRVCGRTDTAEVLVPESVLVALMEHATRPNPYRTLFASAVV